MISKCDRPPSPPPYMLIMLFVFLFIYLCVSAKYLNLQKWQVFINADLFLRDSCCSAESVRWCMWGAFIRKNNIIHWGAKPTWENYSVFIILNLFHKLYARYFYWKVWHFISPSAISEFGAVPLYQKVVGMMAECMNLGWSLYTQLQLLLSWSDRQI